MSEPTFDLATVWREIEAIESPGPAGPPPRPVLPRLVGRTAGAAAFALRALRQSVSGRRKGGAAEDGISACVLAIRQMETRWQKECGETGFVRRRRELEKSKQILEGIATLEAQERRGREERQRQRREALQLALRRGASDLTDCRRAVLARRVELARDLEREHRRLARLRAAAARAWAVAADPSRPA